MLLLCCRFTGLRCVSPQYLGWNHLVLRKLYHLKTFIHETIDMLNCVIHLLSNFFRTEVFKIIQLQHSAHFRIWHCIDCSICMCNQLGKMILLKIQLLLLCIFPFHKEHKPCLWTSGMSICLAK